MRIAHYILYAELGIANFLKLFFLQASSPSSTQSIWKFAAKNLADCLKCKSIFTNIIFLSTSNGNGMHHVHVKYLCKRFKPKYKSAHFATLSWNDYSHYTIQYPNGDWSVGGWFSIMIYNGKDCKAQSVLRYNFAPASKSLPNTPVFNWPSLVSEVDFKCLAMKVYWEMNFNNKWTDEYLHKLNDVWIISVIINSYVNLF